MAAQRRSAQSPLAHLTPREREVLAEIAQGKNNAAVAASLYLSERAVEKHINSLFAKLGLGEEPDVHRRVKAVLLYLSAREGGAPLRAFQATTPPPSRARGRWCRLVEEQAIRRTDVRRADVGPGHDDVLIVDDQAPFRSVARTLVCADGIDVVAEAASARRRSRWPAPRPRLVLMDINLPGINGLEATRPIWASGPAPSSSCCRPITPPAGRRPVLRGGPYVHKDDLPPLLRGVPGTRSAPRDGRVPHYRAQDVLGRVPAAHAVHATAGGRRRRAQVEAVDRRAPGVETEAGAGNELAEVGDAAGDVAADVVGVMVLESGRGEFVAGEDTITEAGRDPLDLSFDAAGHVDRRTVGHVAVGPHRVGALGRPGRVETAAGRAAQTDGRDGVPSHRFLGAAISANEPPRWTVPARDPRIGPRHRSVERPVDLEHAGAVAEPLERTPIAVGQPAARDVDHLARGDVEENRGRGPTEARTATDLPVAFDVPARSSSSDQASAMDCDPPLAIGQPTRCPRIANMRP